MFTSIVVGVDCREAGRDAPALATLLHAAGWGELIALPAGTAAPLIHEDVLILVEAELARAGATGRAIVFTDRSPAHALRTIAEREGAGSSWSVLRAEAESTASRRATTRPRRSTGRRTRSPARSRSSDRGARCPRRRLPRSI